MNTANTKKLYLFFFFFSVLLSFEGMFQLYLNESIHTVLLVSTYVIGVILIQTICLVLSNLISRKFFCLLISSITAFNIISLKLVFFSSFQNVRIIIFVGIYALIFILVYVIYNLIINREKGKFPSAAIYSPVLITLLLVPLTLSGYTDQNQIDVDPIIRNSKVEQWKEVRFKETPNIHLIGFDSMIPNHIGANFFGFDELPYELTLSNHFIRKHQSFAPRIMTKKSLNSTMNLDSIDILESTLYFPGQRPSVLTTVASKNGYQISAGFSNEYLGRGGAFVNHYSTDYKTPISKSILCLDQSNNIIGRSRLFYSCDILKNHARIADLFTGVSEKYTSGKPNWNNNTWQTRVFSIIEELTRAQDPQLSFHHMFKPIGHTRLSYRHDNLTDRKIFKKKVYIRAKEADDLLNLLIKTIKLKDPEAIVLIFGDHGTILSRGMNPDDDPEFYYTDRHTIELALLKTNNKCASEIAFHYAKSYATTSRLLAGIFRCLSTTPEKIDELVSFVDELRACVIDKTVKQIPIIKTENAEGNQCFYFEEA